MSAFASIDRLINGATPSLTAHLWSSTIFLLLILIVLLLGRTRLTAGARHALALIGIIKFAIPSAIFLPLLRLWSPRLSDDSRAAFALPLRVLGGAFPIATPASGRGSWLPLLLLFWLLIAIALIARISLTRHRLVSLSTRTALPPQPREVEALTRARRRVGVRRSIDLARSPVPEAPAVLRIFRPLIVLPPRGCEQLDDDELESLLCHECAHVSRHDNLLARIESLICALFWFHPLLWIAQRITAVERERACDEAVANSADERETFLAALNKFCHASIAPRLPGVSCMATARLKERMDHVMNLDTLRKHSPSARRVTLLAASALAAFTVAMAFFGDNRALAIAKTPSTGWYSIKGTGTRNGDLVTLDLNVRDNRTQKTVAASVFSLGSDGRGNATASNGDFQFTFNARPDRRTFIAVDVIIERNGSLEQKATIYIAPTATTENSDPYTGRPITLALKDADLRDVINTFSKLTGTEMRVDPAVQGRVSINWVNVPWDEAFDSMLKDNGLTYHREGKALVIAPK
ncbi:MAG: hypothetical protein QOK37_3713 [Thermoanaerobaculia bacterium]|nr:hypothetical protein [Thermoanaerobaculia bacterium]